MTAISKAGRTAAGIVALVAWAGLAIQWSASTDGAGGSPLQALWVMSRFFTILCNLVVAIVMTGIALDRRRFKSPTLVGGTALAIMLVGVVYTLLLRGLHDLSATGKIANFLLHNATPALVPLFWLLFAPKGKLGWRDPFRWTLFPLGYFAYALARAAVEHVYPYPFMDVSNLGWPATLTNAVVIAAGFLAVGFGFVWIDRRMR